MDVLGDAVRRDRRSETPALRAPAVGREYDYRRFCTSAWKVGNFLRHLGVRRGAGVAVADDPLPEPVLAFYGAALLGGVVHFHPGSAGDEVRALVVPADDLEASPANPGTKRLAYGDDPADPSVAYFERDVWSENPTAPPDRVGPDDPLLRTSRATYAHGDLVAAAETVVDELALDADTVVAVRGRFADPTVVVTGVIAPILAGGVVALDADEGDVIVGGGDGDAAGIVPLGSDD
jgi:hypothetical protein